MATEILKGDCRAVAGEPLWREGARVLSIKWMERVLRLPGAGMTARERLTKKRAGGSTGRPATSAAWQRTL